MPPATRSDSDRQVWESAPAPVARSLSDEAYVRVRDLIVSLELAPGSVIEEPRLRDRLRVGRTPLREALKRLAHEKLVQFIPNRGTFVAGIDITDLAAITEMRVELEGFGAMLAAERATAAERAGLAELRESLVGLAGSDPRALIDLDRAIHASLYRATHNPYLADTLQEHFNLSLRLWFVVIDRVDLAEAMRQHADLLDAVLERDAPRAQKAMRAHVRAFEQAVRMVL